MVILVLKDVLCLRLFKVCCRVECVVNWIYFILLIRSKKIEIFCCLFLDFLVIKIFLVKLKYMLIIFVEENGLLIVYIEIGWKMWKFFFK